MEHSPMPINLLAINVGNTRTQFAAFVDNKIQSPHRVTHAQTDDLIAALEQALQPLAGCEDPAIYIASVNDAAAEQVIEVLEKLSDFEISRMERDLPVPVGRKLDPETIVGEDRLLNAAAAFDAARGACVVIDAGTAVTIDLIDGKGTFHGGAILPGAQLMLNALHEHTALLPELRFAKPDEPVGHNTAQAMLTAAYHGIRGAARELTEKYAEILGAYPRVIATGGDAQTLFDGYDLIEAIVPELTLLGMAVTRRHAMEQS